MHGGLNAGPGPTVRLEAGSPLVCLQVSCLVRSRRCAQTGGAPEPDAPATECAAVRPGYAAGASMRLLHQRVRPRPTGDGAYESPVDRTEETHARHGPSRSLWPSRYRPRPCPTRRAVMMACVRAAVCPDTLPGYEIAFHQPHRAEFSSERRPNMDSHSPRPGGGVTRAVGCVVRYSTLSIVISSRFSAVTSLPQRYRRAIRKLHSSDLHRTA